MEGLLTGIIAFALILFVVSFIFPNRTKELKEEIEQLSMKVYEENYQIKKRLRLLEEELLIADDFPKRDVPAPFHPIIVNQVKLLHKEGVPIGQIARQAALTEEEVYTILEQIDGEVHGWTGK